MRAYSRRRMDKRAGARLAFYAGIVVLGLFLYWYRDAPVQGVKIFAFVWALPTVWAVRTLLSAHDSVVIDLARGVVISGQRERESPLSRLCPLELEVRSRSPQMDGSSSSMMPTYLVIAKGWNSYVLYQGPWRGKAERVLADMRARCGCAQGTSAPE
jgi:hypothetical protein